MKKTAALAGALVTLTFALTACSGTAGQVEVASTPSPTESTSPNVDACFDFETLSATFATKLTGGVDASGLGIDEYKADLLADRAAFDRMALSAEGDVADRLAAVVDEIPSDNPHRINLDPRDYSTAVTGVQNACSVEGLSITPATITGGFFGR